MLCNHPQGTAPVEAEPSGGVECGDTSRMWRLGLVLFSSFGSCLHIDARGTVTRWRVGSAGGGGGTAPGEAEPSGGVECGDTSRMWRLGLVLFSSLGSCLHIGALGTVTRWRVGSAGGGGGTAPGEAEPSGGVECGDTSRMWRLGLVLFSSFGSCLHIGARRTVTRWRGGLRKETAESPKAGKNSGK